MVPGKLMADNCGAVCFSIHGGGVHGVNEIRIRRACSHKPNGRERRRVEGLNDSCGGGAETEGGRFGRMKAFQRHV